MSKREKDQTEGWLDIIAGRIHCPWENKECPHKKNDYCTKEEEDTCPVVEEN